MSAPPVRIDQIIPSIVERDAVSHHTLEAQAVLRSLGFASDIYALTMGPGLVDRVKPLSELDLDGAERSWLCYQASIGSPAADVFAAHRGVKVVNYHNITPAELVESWMPDLGDEVRLGRQQMAELADVVDLAIAVSPYNERELRAWGYRQTAVATLMMDPVNFEIRPDESCLRALRERKRKGGADWLFVGQRLPHKSHHDVILAFAAYLRAFDPKARLHLVGRDSCQAYALGLDRLVAQLGIGESVDVAGSVDSGQLAAYYEGCDVYVSCSDHEGFGAPLLEAMKRGLPVVAYGAAAVPETIKDAGIQLASKSPADVAAAVHLVCGDEALRRHLVEAGPKRASMFKVERARSEFSDAISASIDRICGKGARLPLRKKVSIRRPARIDQVIPSIVEHDAVSFHTLQAQQVLRSLGYVSEIFAGAMAPELANRAMPLVELPRLSADRHVVCYQASIGSPAAELLAEHPATIVVDYHNVTPAGLLEDWAPQLAESLRQGRRQVEELAAIARFGVGDSAYNVAELDGWGYTDTAVAMLMLDPSNFDVPSDPRATGELFSEKERGGTDWLFVGQILPHKAQHDLLAALAAYRRAYDPSARLHLVGREISSRYALALRELASALGISDAVRFEGLVDPARLSALYQSCDVYVSCSDHEGFGAPLVEAMHHGLPVVAFAAAAVPETIGDSGVLLQSKTPAEVAAAVHHVLGDQALHERVVHLSRRQADAFAPEIGRRCFAEVMEWMLATWSAS